MPWTASKNPAVQRKWRTRVDAWRRSGKTGARFCRSLDYSATSLRFWSDWFDGFSPQLPALVEVRLPEVAPAPVGDPTMWVSLSGGRQVGVCPGFTPSALAQLVITLERL